MKRPWCRHPRWLALHFITLLRRTSAFTTARRSMSRSAWAWARRYSRVMRLRQGKRLEARHHLNRTVQVMKLVAPAAEEGDVLAVQVAVGIEAHVARVGVLAHHDVAPGVAHHLEPLAHRGGMARGLDHHVGPPARRAVPHPPRPGRGIALLEHVERVLGAQAARGLEAGQRSPDHQDPQGACELREDAALRPTGPLPCTTTVSPRAIPRAPRRGSRWAARSRRP